VALTNKINLLKEHDLTQICVAAHWLARRVIPLKKQVHSGREYSGFKDLTRETNDEQVRSYHIGVERDPVRSPG
jgi:hypothetical protein